MTDRKPMIEELVIDFLNPLFNDPDRSKPAMTENEKEIIRAGAAILATGLHALLRIADAAEAMLGPRPAENPHDGIPR